MYDTTISQSKSCKSSHRANLTWPSKTCLSQEPIKLPIIAEYKSGIINETRYIFYNRHLAVALSPCFLCVI